MASSEIELSVVFPCLNEAETVGPCVEKALACIKAEGIDGEVVVADNGSTDESAEIATKAGARVVPIPERGYGAALIGGIEAARGRFVIMLDADGSYDAGGLKPFVDRLRAGEKFVMGNRFAGGIAQGAMPFKNKHLGNPFFTFLGNLVTGYKIGDFLCGMRGFDRETVLSLNLETPGMEYAMEMLVRAAQAGLKVTEVPTTLAPDGRSHPPHLRPWRDGRRTLVYLIAAWRSPRALPPASTTTE